MHFVLDSLHHSKNIHIPLEAMNADYKVLDVAWAAFLTPDYCEHAFAVIKDLSARCVRRLGDRVWGVTQFSDLG